MLIKGGLVLDFDKGCFTMEDIRVCGSKITEMAPSLAPQAGEDVLDASGSYITPGLIDAHSHLLISEEGMGSIGGGYTRLEFLIPSRGLIGYRGEFMTDTKGNGIINTTFEEYGPYKGDMNYRKQGSLIAFETGETVAYGLFNAQDRGTLFVGPGEKVYSGMVIGQNGKAEDIELNVCKTKHLTNTRSSSADDALKLVPPKKLSLEEALEFIDTDELLEITPKSLRIRKKILDSTLRFRSKKNAQNN